MNQQAADKLNVLLKRLDQIQDEQVVDLPSEQSWPETRHRFHETDIWAVRAALAAQRPLLLRGEPGIGKSQLARAAAHVLQLPFLYKVIDARCESADLLYDFDAVSRLAQAQIMHAVDDQATWRDQLMESRFVRPGILWWAFDWTAGCRQAKNYGEQRCPEPPSPVEWNPGDGCVVLIDEIDKAESDLPNGLLEAFGNLGFAVPHTGDAVALSEDAVAPLVVVTTNEERELPAAFLRRCLVHGMSMDQHHGGESGFLLERGRDHFGDEILDADVYERAAKQLLQDRDQIRGQGLCRPGASEYLDLLRVLARLCPSDKKGQLSALAKIQGFALEKNSRDLGW